MVAEPPVVHSDGCGMWVETKAATSPFLEQFLAEQLKSTGGKLGGTLGDKGKEIRVRTGKFTLTGLVRTARDKWRNVYWLCWK